MNTSLEQKILDHIDQSLVAFRSSMSPEIVKQLASDVAYIKVEQERQSKLLDTHLTENQDIYDFFKKAKETARVGNRVGSFLYFSMKWTVIFAATIGAFILTIKGWWVAFITMAVKPLI